jgi:hypothetical protein
MVSRENPGVSQRPRPLSWQSTASGFQQRTIAAGSDIPVVRADKVLRGKSRTELLEWGAKLREKYSTVCAWGGRLEGVLY